MQRIGLERYFELCLTARDVGAAKPDVRAFNAVLQALGAQAHQVAYVGDDPHADVAGARAAGLRSIWVDRGVLLWPDALPRADLEVHNLTELAALSLGDPG
jgi:putative hydrolase of the HAD superfamily